MKTLLLCKVFYFVVETVASSGHDEDPAGVQYHHLQQAV